MQIIDKIYIGGAFVRPHGDELFDLFNPATEQIIGRVLLADAQDARDAIAAAKHAYSNQRSKPAPFGDERRFGLAAVLTLVTARSVMSLR